MRWTNVTALALATSVCAGCGRLERAASERAATGIRATNAALDSAYQAGDAGVASRLFTEDATLMPPAGRDLRGRQPIRSFLDLYFRRVTVGKYTLTTVELDVYGDMAYEFGTYEWSAVNAAADTVNEVGRYTAVRIKGDDDVWRIHRLMDNAMPHTEH